MWATFALAIRNVTRHKMRSAMTLLSVIFGVVSLILAGGFIEDTIVEVGESMIHSYSGHIQVSPRGYFAFGTQQPERYLIAQPEPLRKKLSQVPGVKDVLLRLSFSGLINNGRTDWPIIGEGVEPELEARLGSYVTVTAGRQMNASDVNGVMLGQGVANALRLKPGDVVNLLVSTAGGAANSLEFEVMGVFQTYSKDYDARAVQIPLKAAQDLMATQGAHTAVVLLNRTEDTVAAAASLPALLSGGGLESKTWIELNDFYTSTVTLYQQQFGFLVAIIMVMLVLSVANTVNMGIFERVGEFGTMRAVGQRSVQIFGLIVLENLVLGFLGSVVGVILGVVLAYQISAVGIPMPPPPNADLGYVSHILIVPKYIALAFIVGLLACVFAAIRPAWRVSRLDIAEALRAAV